MIKKLIIIIALKLNMNNKKIKIIDSTLKSKIKNSIFKSQKTI